MDAITPEAKKKNGRHVCCPSAETKKKIVYLLLLLGLATTTDVSAEVDSRFVPKPVVILQGLPVFKLLPSKEQPLLVWWNAGLCHKHHLDKPDVKVFWDIEGNGLAFQTFDKDLDRRQDKPMRMPTPTPTPMRTPMPFQYTYSNKNNNNTFCTMDSALAGCADLPMDPRRGGGLFG